MASIVTNEDSSKGPKGVDSIKPNINTSTIKPNTNTSNKQKKEKLSTKIINRLNQLTPTTSKESIQTFTNWILFHAANSNVHVNDIHNGDNVNDVDNNGTGNGTGTTNVKDNNRHSVSIQQTLKRVFMLDFDNTLADVDVDVDVDMDVNGNRDNDNDTNSSRTSSKNKNSNKDKRGDVEIIKWSAMLNAYWSILNEICCSFSTGSGVTFTGSSGGGSSGNSAGGASGIGIDMETKWNKYSDFRSSLAEMVILPLLEDLFHFLEMSSIHTSTSISTNTRTRSLHAIKELRDKLDNMHSKWKDVDSFQSPTLLDQIKRVIVKIVQFDIDGLIHTISMNMNMNMNSNSNMNTSTMSNVVLSSTPVSTAATTTTTTTSIDTSTDTSTNDKTNTMDSDKSNKKSTSTSSGSNDDINLNVEMQNVDNGVNTDINVNANENADVEMQDVTKDDKEDKDPTNKTLLEIAPAVSPDITVTSPANDTATPGTPTPSMDDDDDDEKDLFGGGDSDEDEDNDNNDGVKDNNTNNANENADNENLDKKEIGEDNKDEKKEQMSTKMDVDTSTHTTGQNSLKKDEENIKTDASKTKETNDKDNISNTKKRAFIDLDAEIDFEKEGIPKGHVEVEELRIPCKTIVTMQITRDLRNDVSHNLSSSLSLVPKEVYEKCEKALVAEDGGDSTIFSKDFPELPDDILDVDIEDAISNIQLHRQIIEKQMDARRKCIELLIKSRCEFNSKVDAEKFYSLGDISSLLVKRKAQILDAMELEGLDFEGLDDGNGQNEELADDNPSSFTWLTKEEAQMNQGTKKQRIE